MATAAGFLAPGTRWQWPALALGVAALYYAGARLGMALVAAPAIAPLWPPNALLLAGLLLTPRHGWWVLIAAVFPADLLAQAAGGVPWEVGVGRFASDVAQALLAALMLQALGGPGPLLRNIRTAVLFLCVTVIASFASAFVDAALGLVQNRGASYAALWETSFFSNVLAILAFVPALVTCVQAPAGEFPRLARGQAAEAAALGGGLLLACTIAVHASGAAPLSAVLLCLPVPFLTWAALRFGPSLSSAAFACVAVIAIASALREASGSPEHAALPVQLMLVAVALPLLLLAAQRVELQATEHGWQGSREIFAAAFGTCPDAMAVVRRADGWVVEANGGWTQLLGPPGPGQVERLDRLLDAASRRTLHAIADQGQVPQATEVTLVPASGEARTALLTRVAVDVDGEACDLFVLRDVTQQKRAEREAATLGRQLTHLTRVASLSDFSGTLAHELNQPLAAILSNAQAAQRMLALDKPNVAEVRVILRDIAESDKRAGMLIHHLRLLMKNSPEAFAPVDVNHLVRQVLDLVAGEFLQRKVATKISLANDLPHVHGDAVQLQQLVLNLVLNACEAMHHDSGPDRVLSVDTHHGADGTVQLLVGDTGPGISPERLAQVFDPFYTTKPNGLGLGLSICRKIAITHHGLLSAQSQPGQGARFRIVLPAIRAGAAPAQRVAGATERATNS